MFGQVKMERRLEDSRARRRSLVLPRELLLANDDSNTRVVYTGVGLRTLNQSKIRLPN